MKMDALQKQVDALLQRVERLEAIKSRNRKTRLQCLESVVCSEMSVTLEELRGPSTKRRIHQARHLLCYIANKRYQIQIRTLQTSMQKSRGAVKQGIKIAQKRVREISRVARLVDRIMERAETERSLT